MGPWSEPAAHGASQFSPFELEDLAGILVQHRAQLLRGALAGLCFGLALFLLLPAQYTASTTMLVARADLLKSERYQIRKPPGIREHMDTLRVRALSDANLSDLIERVGEERLDPSGERSRAELMAEIRDSLELEVGSPTTPKAKVAELTYRAHDPTVAAQMAGEIARIFVSEHVEDWERQFAAAATHLERRLEQSRRAIEEHEIRIREAEQAGPAIRRAHIISSLQKITALRDELFEAERRYTDAHPSVKHLRAEIARLEREHERFAGHGQVGIDARDISVSALMREHQRLVSVHMQLLEESVGSSTRHELLRARKAEEFQVLHVAPARRATHTLLFPPVGALVGFGLVALLIGFGELRNAPFRSVRGLVGTLGVPVLASVPRIDSRMLATPAGTGGVAARLVVHTAPDSTAAEQYRSALPCLLESDECRVVLVTSAARGDGKSVTTANLAASAAIDLRWSTLLIDADLRRPMSHALFDVPIKRGLSDVLEGRSSLEESTLESSVPNLSLLPAGRARCNPLELLSSDKFLDLIREARGSYRAVFIDSPPLLPVVDTRLIKDMADLVLFIVRAGTTPREAVLRSLSQIREVGGVIFNDVDSLSYRRYYSYYPTEHPYAGSFRDEEEPPSVSGRSGGAARDGDRPRGEGAP